MVYTTVQTTALFEDAAYAALSARTRGFLQAQGITAVADPGEWHDDDWDSFSKLGRRPPQVTDPNNAGQYINDQPYVVSVGSLKFLKKTSTWIRALISWDYDITHFKMSKRIIDNFLVNSTAAEKRFKQIGGNDAPTIGKMSMPEFENVVYQDMGKQQSCRDDIVCSLEYLLRSDAARAAETPLMAHRAFTAGAGSVQKMHERNLSHDHTLFEQDNATLFVRLEEGTRGSKTMTQYWQAKVHKMAGEPS